MAFENFFYLYISYESTFNHTTMKKLLTFLFLFVFAHSVMADNGTAIKILLDDGTSHIFQLEDNPTASFNGDILVITCKKQEVSVNLDNGAVVQVMYVINDDINEVKNGHQSIYRITDYGLDANGLKPNTVVYVYDLNGAVIAEANVGQDGSLRIPLRGKGVFIVKTSISSIKIKK